MKNFLVLTWFCLIPFTSSWAQLVTVPFVDLTRYAGTWYQIAANPLPFEGNCRCSRQVLTPIDDKVAVFNSCTDPISGQLRTISGFAYNQDRTTNAIFKVDFGFPTKGDYWIIGLDEDYRWAVVSDPRKISLFILSKTPVLNEELFQQALNEAQKQVSLSRLRKMEQENCNYP
jgi:apolipoprotein D and lipocalin family protein